MFAAWALLPNGDSWHNLSSSEPGLPMRHGSTCASVMPEQPPRGAGDVDAAQYFFNQGQTPTSHFGEQVQTAGTRGDSGGMREDGHSRRCPAAQQAQNAGVPSLITALRRMPLGTWCLWRRGGAARARGWRQGQEAGGAVTAPRLYFPPWDRRHPDTPLVLLM